MTDGAVTVSHDIIYYQADQGEDYGEGSADDEHRLSGDFFAEGVPVGLDVGAEHGYRALGDVLTDELI